MKKFLGFLTMATMLLVTGCKDDLMPTGGNGEEITVQFTIGTESATSVRRKAPGVNYDGINGYAQISDGSKADKLIYAVYDANGNILEQFGDGTSPLGQTTITDITFPHTISLRLVRGQQYTFAFWAQSKECTAYNTTDLKAVKVDYQSDDNTLCNYELRDAFCKAETFTVVQSGKRSVILTRPFAQINVGITKADYQTAMMSQLRVVKSKIHIENVATEFNIVSNCVNTDGPDKLQTVDYDFNIIPAYTNFDDIPTEDRLADAEQGQEAFLKVDMNHDGDIIAYGMEKDGEQAETYKYLMMCYILPADRTDGTSTYSTTLDKVKVTFKTESDIDIVLEDGLENIPVQRNWRTNIVGDLLTADIKLVIDLDPIYSGDYNAPDYLRIAEGVAYDPVEDCITLSNGMALQWFSDISNGAWLGKEEYNNANKGGNADLLLEAVKLTEWPSDGVFNFYNTTLKLTNDVDFELASAIEGVRREWTPISWTADFNKHNTGAFEGTFDGGNHTVSNIIMVREDNIYKDDYGFFGNVKSSAVIKNLRLFNVDIESHYRTGAIVGCAFGREGDWSSPLVIKNCYVDRANILVTPWTDGNGYYDEANNIGGIIGQANCHIAIDSCYVRQSTLRGYRVIGGIMGTDNGDWPIDGIRNCTVSDVTLIADQFQPYFNAPYGWGDIKATMLDEIIGRNLTGGEIINNTFYNVRKIEFALDHKEGEYPTGTRYARIAGVDLDIIPRLNGLFAEVINIGSSLLGAPTAFKNYTDDAEGAGEADKSSDAVGVYVKGIMIDGKSDDNKLDNYTITVSNVKPAGSTSQKICALYLVADAAQKYNAIRNLTIHGDLYVDEGICLAPVANATINIDTVSVYDATKVLTDGGTGAGNLIVTESNFRGDVTLGSGYSSVTFTNTVFESATDNSNQTFSSGSTVTFDGCTFKAPYTITANGTFNNCIAVGSNPDKTIPITGACTIVLNPVTGEPEIQ